MQLCSAKSLDRCTKSGDKFALENGARLGFNLIDVGLESNSGFEVTLEGAAVSQAQVNPGTFKMVLKLSYSDPEIKPVLIPFNAIIDSC